MASERTILLTHLDSAGLDGGKERENRERKERGEEEEGFRERESIFSLDFLTIDLSNPETRSKVDPHRKSYAWAPILWILETPGGRGFSHTWLSSYIRTVQMVGVFRARKVVCFGTESWKFWTVSESPGWVWRLPSGGPDCVFMMI